MSIPSSESSLSSLPAKEEIFLPAAAEWTRLELEKKDFQSKIRRIQSRQKVLEAMWPQISNLKGLCSSKRKTAEPSTPGTKSAPVSSSSLLPLSPNLDIEETLSPSSLIQDMNFLSTSTKKRKSLTGMIVQEGKNEEKKEEKKEKEGAPKLTKSQKTRARIKRNLQKQIEKSIPYQPPSGLQINTQDQNRIDRIRLNESVLQTIGENLAAQSSSSSSSSSSSFPSSKK